MIYIGAGKNKKTKKEKPHRRLTIETRKMVRILEVKKAQKLKEK